MIRRIVKMTFRTAEIPAFIALFEQKKEAIRSFPGCLHLELWRVQDEHSVCFTFSIWESEEALDAYRRSTLFMETWAQTKLLFSDKPQAWSLDLINQPLQKSGFNL